jgi:superfamily II DNA or RNA helicase
VAGGEEVKLRPYQIQALAALEHRHITTLPTGTGKTAIMAEHAMRELRKERSTLVLVHREELIPQTQKALALAGVPEKSVGIVQAARRDPRTVTIAMQQTIRGMADLPKVHTAIVDEAHRYTTEKSGHAVLDALEAQGANIYGFTATPSINMKPIYGPGKPFVGISFKRTIPWAIMNGFLSDVRGRSIRLGMDLKKVKTDRAGDYAAGSLATAMLRVRAPERIVESWQTEAQGRTRTIAFCPTVEFGEALTRAFKKVTERVGQVYGTTATTERAATIESFRKGETEVLINVIVGAEGFDVPEVDCVVMARPTKSWTLYTQCVGRGLRPAPGKVDCLVLDYSGASQTLDLATLPKIVGAKDLKQGKSLRKLVEERTPAELDIDYGVAEMEEALLFAPVAWTQVGEEFVATFDSGHVVTIAPVEDEDDSIVSYGVFLVELKSGAETEVGLFPFASDAGAAAEELIREEGEGSLSKRRAPWRRGEVTPAQMKFFRNGGAPATRGEAADQITLLLYRRARGMKR